MKKIIPFILFTLTTPTFADNFDFETGDFTDWNTSDNGVFSNKVGKSGRGVQVDGQVSITLSGNGQDLDAPVTFNWTFDSYGDNMAILQPGSGTFDEMATALQLSDTSVTNLKTLLSEQAAETGWGKGKPTNAAYISQSITMNAGDKFEMAWNYTATDYVPFNDGSITTLVNTTDGTQVGKVNNYEQEYALLGFSNPGTGDYSTGSFGSTGWQVSTYEALHDGEYLLGFGTFNLDDTALGPVLMVDSLQGTTTLNGETFGAIAPNEGTLAPNSGIEPVITYSEPVIDADRPVIVTNLSQHNTTETSDTQKLVVTTTSSNITPMEIITYTDGVETERNDTTSVITSSVVDKTYTGYIGQTNDAAKEFNRHILRMGEISLSSKTKTFSITSNGVSFGYMKTDDGNKIGFGYSMDKVEVSLARTSADYSYTRTIGDFQNQGFTSQTGYEAYIGYNFTNSKLDTIIGAAYQNATIDGYSETGDMQTAITMGERKVSNLVGIADVNYNLKDNFTVGTQYYTNGYRDVSIGVKNEIVNLSLSREYGSGDDFHVGLDIEIKF